MKIRNLAFCGVMASILSGWGALAADGDTIIASKAYVDAMDATKQNNSDRVTDTWANSTADHSSTTKYPSMNTLDSAISGLNTSIGTGAWTANALDSTAQTTDNKAKLAKVEAFQNTAQRAASGTATAWDTTSGDGSNDNKFPTTKAVTQQLELLDAALSGDIDAIEGLFEIGMGETAMNAYASWVEDGMSTSGEKYEALINAIRTDTKYHNVVTDDAKDHQNLIPRNSNITKGIAYALGTGIEHHTSNFDIDAEGVAQKTDTAWETIKRDKATDDYVPTVAAVERRVERAVTQAGNNISKETTNVLTSHANNTAQNGNDNKLTTVAAIAATTKYAAGTAPTAASGRWQTTDSTATATYASDRDLTTQKAVTQQFEALDQSTYGSNTATTGTGAVTMPVTAVTQTDGLITASRGKITFDDAMDAGLSNVNVSGGNYSSSCTAANPCVLTYFDGHYEWTAMDTENVSAVN